MINNNIINIFTLTRLLISQPKSILPLIIILAKIPTHTFLDPNMLQQDMIQQDHT